MWQILTRPEARSFTAHAKVQPEECTQDAELLFCAGSAESIAGLVKDVDGQGSLALLRICQGNGHPGRLYHTLVLQKNAKLGGVVGQLDEVDFDLLNDVALSDSYINDAGNIREALRLDSAIDGAVAVDAVGETVRSSHGGLQSRGGEEDAEVCEEVEARRGRKWARYTPIKVAPLGEKGG